VLRPPFILPASPILALEGDHVRLARRADAIDDVLRSYVLSGARAP